MALAKDLDRPPATVIGDFLGDVSQGDRKAGPMCIAAGGCPTVYSLSMPNRFITDHVGIICLNHETAQPQASAACLLASGGDFADEIGILPECYESIQAGF
jgi:hypothetical protein